MNAYDYYGNSQMTDGQDGMNDTQDKKAPNIFMQLIYSVMPGKYGELANVKVKGFIFFYLFWCFILCSAAWTILLTIALIDGIGERLANGYVLSYEKLPAAILLLIVISIVVCLLMTIIVAVISAIIYFFEGVPVAFFVKVISKKECSLFDLYKSTIYCQTPQNIAILCMLVSLELLADTSWMSVLIWIARIASLVILIFGIRNLPAKPFLPEKKQSKTESNPYRTEDNQYGIDNSQYRWESSQYETENNQFRWEGDSYKEESNNHASSTPSKPRVTPGYWACSCGRENPSYTGTCACGKSKY